MLNKLSAAICFILLALFFIIDPGRFTINIVQANTIIFGLLYAGVIFYLLQESLGSILCDGMRVYMEAFYRLRYYFIGFFVCTLFFARQYVAYYQISYFNEFTQAWFNDTFYLSRQFGYLMLVMGTLYYIHFNNARDTMFKYLLMFLLSFVFLPYAYDLLAFVQDITIQHFWQSTIWVFYTFTNLLVMFFAVILITHQFVRRHDISLYGEKISGLLFGMNIFWAYLFVCQFLIVMYGNVPSLVEGYNIRFEYSWVLYQVIVLLLHLVLPFILLFTRKSKSRSTNVLMASYSTIMAVMLDFMCYFVPVISKVGISIYEYSFFAICFVFFVIIFTNTLFKEMRKNVIINNSDSEGRLQ